MASLVGFLTRNYTTLYPSAPPKERNALKFGVLGAAAITPLALINPARSHPGVIIEAVAARDIERAQVFAKKHGIPRVFASYQELLDDPSIDVIYNPLPNALHYEWTMKALKAGKHVLLEKPASDVVEEAVKMFALANEKNLVLLEAFHYRFHPAIQTVRAIVQSGAIGKVKGVETALAMPIFPGGKEDIRANYSLGGGSMMDMGCYAINCFRYVLDVDPIEVMFLSTNTYLDDKQIDRSMRVVFNLPNDVTAAVYSDLNMPKHIGFIPRVPDCSIQVDGDEGSVYLNNYIAPSIWHNITVKKGKEIKSVKAYTIENISKTAKGEAWWTTYRWQLEAFTDKVQGRVPQTWVTAEDSIANMKAIEEVYEASSLGVRPKSSYLGQE